MPDQTKQPPKPPLAFLQKPLEGSVDALLSFLGLKEQKPGDLATALGAGASAVSMIPPKTAKELSRLMVALMDEGKMKNSFQALQQKFPRVLGHVTEISTDPIKGDTYGYLSGVLGRQRTSPVDPKLSTLTYNNKDLKTRLFQSAADNIAAHELTHVAQQLRLGKRFEPMYNIADNKLGYDRNPFEIAANAVGSKFEQTAKNLRSQPTLDTTYPSPDLIRELDSRITGLAPEPGSGRPIYPDSTENIYQKILQQGGKVRK